MKWTNEQSEAISKRNSNILVSAAAGSGKTAVLIERIKRIILEDGVSVDRMLVVTFTNAAASEMKEKLARSLRTEFVSCEDSTKRMFLRHQLSLLGRANISTFHAFALEVVRRYYHIIGISPALRICDETRKALLMNEAARELFETLFEEGDPDFISMLTDYCSSRNNDTLRDIIFSFYEFTRSLADAEGWRREATSILTSPFKGGVDNPLADYLLERTEQLLATCIRYLQRALDILSGPRKEDGTPVIPQHISKVATDIAALEVLAEQASEGDIYALKEAFGGGFRFAGFTALPVAARPYYEDIKEEVTSFRDRGKKVFAKIKDLYGDFLLGDMEKENELVLEKFNMLCRLTKRFEAVYAEKKEEAGVLDFSDAEHFALRILEDPNVREEYREKFIHIFIDEYQDSNLVQETLISRIASENNVFRVGDVKQCIYKFRLAEPELFVEKYEEFKDEKTDSGHVIELNKNFRSKQGVIDFVNDVFSSAMTKKDTGIEYNDDVALKKGSSYDGSLEPVPEIFLIDSSAVSDEIEDGEDSLEACGNGKDGADRAGCEDGVAGKVEDRASVSEDGSSENIDEEILDLEKLELEACFISKIIKENLGKPIYDDSIQAERPLEYKDIAILSRWLKNKGEVFYKILSDEGIPLVYDRKEGCFDTIEIQVFMNILRLVDNGKRDVPLLSVLVSPAFSFDAEQLASIRVYANEAGKGKISFNEAFYLYSKKGEDGELRKKCENFSSALKFWRREVRHRSLADAVREILSGSGYGHFASSLPGGEQRMANLSALVEKAAEYERENAEGLYGFISYIESIAARGEGINVGQAKLISDDAKAVRLMTIHGSKGLEFPYVILSGADIGMIPRSDHGPYMCHRKLGASFKLVDRKRGLSYDTLSLRILRDKQRRDEIAEAVRLLYVAMTRAKDKLTIVGSYRDPYRFVNGVKTLLTSDVESAESHMALIFSSLPERPAYTVVDRMDIASWISSKKINASELFGDLEKGFKIEKDEATISADNIKKLITYDYRGGDAPMGKMKYTVSQLCALERGESLNVSDLPVPFTLSFGREGEADLFEKDVAEENDFEESISSFKTDISAIPQFVSGRRKITAAEIGNAYHKVMELIPFEESFVLGEGNSARISEFVDGLKERNLLDDTEAKSVEPEKIANFFSSDIGLRALRAKEIHRESPFILRTSYDGSEVLLQGVLDCWFEEEDGCVLIDYKSGFMAGRDERALAEAAEYYRPQLSYYAKALESIKGCKVKECVIFFFAPGESVVVG